MNLEDILKTENKLFMIPKYRKSSYISAKKWIRQPNEKVDCSQTGKSERQQTRKTAQI